MSFQIFTTDEVASFRKGGKILAGCLQMLKDTAKEGMTTKALDLLAETYIRDHGGLPAFKGYRDFPATLCTSVNEQCVHGIPSDRVLKGGDIVSLDCGVLVDELYTDACITVGIGKISPDVKKLLTVTEQALEDAVSILKPGIRVGDLSSVIQKTVERAGFHPVKQLTGHGLGYTLHQFPDIPNRGSAATGAVFPAWTVVAVEPIVSIADDNIETTGDGWTLVTETGSLAAHFEHTLLLTAEGCEVLA